MLILFAAANGLIAGGAMASNLHYELQFNGVLQPVACIGAK